LKNWREASDTGGAVNEDEEEAEGTGIAGTDAVVADVEVVVDEAGWCEEGVCATAAGEAATECGVEVEETEGEETLEEEDDTRDEVEVDEEEKASSWRLEDSETCSNRACNMRGIETERGGTRDKR